jgi:hypothetical protein
MAVQVFSRVVDPASCGGVPECTGAFASDIIAGLEHVYAAALSGLPIASVNMSLGGGLFQEACDDQPYKPAIDNLRAVGVPTVIAAGNTGWPFGLSTPACISTAVSVGSTTKADTVSSFSNASTLLSLFAPGESILSAVPGGAFEALSGTSMATPHVAGAWAVVKQAAPSATVGTVLQTLRTTGLPITDSRIWFLPGATVPRIRLFEALAALVPIDGPAPILSGLTPASARAGLGSITVAVSGSGFIGRSTVQWNGAARATRFVNSSRLEATITAGDLAAAGTAQVRVATASPGGGTTSEMAFSIMPPPSLTVNRTTVAPGDAVTVELSEGIGGSTDWLALAATGAPNTSYLQWTYVGAGVTSRTWTVAMPSAGGTYEFRLFVGGVKAATSPAVTVDPALTPAPVITSLSPASAFAGGAAFTLTVNGSRFAAASTVRWNGSTRATTFVSTTKLLAAVTAADIATSGNAQVTVFTPAPGGGTSAAIPFEIKPPPTITVSATNVAAGAPVTATLTNGLGQTNDWIALAVVGSPDTSYLQWTYVGAGVTSRTWTVSMPQAGGLYEFRLFRNGYIRVATSPSVSVAAAAPPALTVNATSVAGSAAVTVTLTNGLGGASDWIGLAAVGSPNTSYIQWTYVGAGITSRTWTVNMPAGGGTFEFRLFRNGYVRVATSPQVTVTPGPPPTLTVSSATAPPGGSVTVTLAHGLGGATDWLALAVVGASNTSYLQWTYVGAGVTARTWTVTMPAAPGNYEFRLFLNNVYSRAATSPPVSVVP